MRAIIPDVARQFDARSVAPPARHRDQGLGGSVDDVGADPDKGFGRQSGTPKCLACDDGAPTGVDAAPGRAPPMRPY
jgi:hypothetical protein